MPSDPSRPDDRDPFADLEPDGRPLALFDLDRTLLVDRTVLHLGRRFGVLDDVQRIWDEARSQELAAGEDETVRIAQLFAGQPVDLFAVACREVPFRPEAGVAVRALQGMGFRVGVVSAGYHFATAHARYELGLDLDVGVVLGVEGGIITGEVFPPRYPGPCGQYICKESVLARAAKATRAPFTLAVGDGRNDVCMVERADLGFGIEPCHELLRGVADHVVKTLDEIPAFVRGRTDTARERV